MAPAAGIGEFNGGGVFTLDNATFVGMGTFVADMGVITMSAHAMLCRDAFTMLVVMGHVHECRMSVFEYTHLRWCLLASALQACDNLKPSSAVL